MIQKLVIVAIVALAITLTAGVFLYTGGAARNANPGYYGIYYGKKAPDFTLSGPDGRDLSLSNFRGRDVLLLFGYTSCPDICPTTLSQLNAVTEKLGDASDDVQVLFVTVDPERDTPERLREYIPYFNESFIGLSGTPEEIKKVADDYSIFYEKESRAENGNSYFMNHTQTVYLIDSEGQLFLVYPFENFEAGKIASDIKLSLKQDGILN